MEGQGRGGRLIPARAIPWDVAHCLATHQPAGGTPVYDGIAHPCIRLRLDLYHLCMRAISPQHSREDFARMLRGYFVGKIIFFHCCF
jgi:hypothetical protein